MKTKKRFRQTEKEQGCKMIGKPIKDHIIQNLRIGKNDMETEEETRAGQGSGKFPCPETD